MKKRCCLLSFIICFTSLSAVAQKLPSADAIIARYVKVIGGEKLWAAIKTSEFHGIVALGDKKLNMLVIKAGPGKYYQNIEGDGLSIVELFDSGSAIVIQNGTRKKITDTVMLDHYGLQSYILPDMNYIKLQYKRQVAGLENINGVACYKIILTSKSGSVNVNYYEKKSGLLTMIEKNDIKFFLTDYKFYKGCSIPYTTSTVYRNGNSVVTKVTDWQINQKSSVELYHIKKRQAQLK